MSQLLHIINNKPYHKLIWDRPSRIDSAPKHTASKPEPQSLLIVNAGEWTFKPDRRATWRAKYAPSKLDWITFPKNVSSIFAAGTFACSSAPFELCTAKSVAVRFFNFPPKAPKGVRLAPTIKIDLKKHCKIAIKLINSNG